MGNGSVPGAAFFIEGDQPFVSDGIEHGPDVFFISRGGRVFAGDEEHRQRPERHQTHAWNDFRYKRGQESPVRPEENDQGAGGGDVDGAVEKHTEPGGGDERGEEELQAVGEDGQE